MALTQVKTSGIADDAVTLGKLDGGTDGNLITYNASGDPAAVAAGNDGQVLTSQGAGNVPQFETLPTSGAALTGSTNNTITTVTGANAIQGEANLTFDGTDLSVTGKILVGTTALGANADDLCLSTAANTGLSIKSGTSSAGNIYFADGTSGTDLYRGFISYNHSGDALSLGTANTTALSIDSFGNVEADIGNIVIGTAGKGIDFSATSDGAGTDTSELLDDYEEGTFTPTLQCSTTNPSYGGGAAGVYTKIGRQVTCSGYIDTNPLNSNGSGNLYIYGFPYSPANLTGNNVPSHASITTYGQSWGGDGYQICASMDESNARMNLKQSQNNGGQSHWTWTESGWSQGDAIYFTVTYQAS